MNQSFWLFLGYLLFVALGIVTVFNFYETVIIPVYDAYCQRWHERRRKRIAQERERRIESEAVSRAQERSRIDCLAHAHRMETDAERARFVALMERSGMDTTRFGLEDTGGAVEVGH